MDEINRIINEYSNKEEKRARLWTFFNKVNLHLVHEREKKLLNQLHKLKVTELSDLKILDIGCGYGGEIARFIYYGANPANLTGIDLLEYRIKKARQNFPAINFLAGDASELSFEDNYFDIIIQMTVFSSIRDNNLRHKIAGEIERVIKPGGLIIWYDILPVSRFCKKINRLSEIILIFMKDPRYFFAKLKTKFYKTDPDDKNLTGFKISVQEINSSEVIGLFKNSKIIYSEKTGIIYSLLELSLKIPIIFPLINSINSFKTNELLILKKFDNKKNI